MVIPSAMGVLLQHGKARASGAGESADLAGTNYPSLLASSRLRTFVAACALLGSPLEAQTEWPDVSAVTVPGVGTRARPLALRHAGDGSGRLFIVEQGGQIHVLRDGTLSVFLDLTARVRSQAAGGGNEQGLLGLAFAPDFAESGVFYVNYTRRTPSNDGATVIARFQRLATGGPLAAGDAASEEILLTVAQPFDNHNGGDMHFGPDGFLYVGFGDGGSGGDPSNRAQNPQEWHGKMLRLDVTSPVEAPATYLVPADNPFVGQPSVRPEVWALGLRNPWRWSFDRLTGDLYIADVGQGAFEEVNFQPAGQGGLNYQWRRMEAFGLHNSGTTLTVGTSTPPILDSRRADGHQSITGGYVYRGSRYPRMRGIYIYADFISNTLFLARQVDEVWQQTTLSGRVNRASSFGEDEAGELYYTNLSGGTVHALRDTIDADHLRVLAVTRDPSDGRVSLTFGAALGRSYQPEVSTDMVTWTPVGATLAEPANGDHRLTYTEAAAAAPGAEQYFLRVRELF